MTTHKGYTIKISKFIDDAEGEVINVGYVAHFYVNNDHYTMRHEYDTKQQAEDAARREIDKITAK